MKHEERRRVCVPLQGVVILETSYISLDDCFAALQIDLSVRGWIGAFATLAAYTIPISSRTMSFPVNSTDCNPRRPPLPKTRRIIALPIPESKRKKHNVLQKDEIASLPRFRTDLLSVRYFCCFLCCYFGWCRPARHCGVVVGDTAPELCTGLCPTRTTLPFWKG